MKLRTALYDGHTELVTQEELEAASTFVGATVGGSAGDLLISDGVGNADAFTAGAGEVVFVDVDGHAATSANLTFDQTTGDSATSTVTLSATDTTFGDTTTISIGVELPGAPSEDNPNGDLVLRLKGDPVLSFKGDETHYAMFNISGTIIASPAMRDMTIEANELGAAILRSDTINPTHSNEIAVLGNADEIDISFLTAGAGGLYITPTFFKPADDNLQDFGASGNRWKNGYFGTSVSTPIVAQVEISTPSAPADGSLVIYAKAAGGGKTGLYVLFPSGAEQQIKVEA